MPTTAALAPRIGAGRVTVYPGWDDERHCPTGLLGYIQADGERPVYEPLAEEIAVQQRARPTRKSSSATKDATRSHVSTTARTGRETSYFH